MGGIRLVLVLFVFIKSELIYLGRWYFILVKFNLWFNFSLDEGITILSLRLILCIIIILK